MKACKVDRNQPEIVAALRSIGAVVRHVHIIKGFYDILVLYRGKSYHVEIKDGLLPESKKKLTPMEKQCKAEFESVGVKYWVIDSIEEALEMLEIK